MAGSGGRIERCFSQAGQLGALIARCKGEANFNDAAYSVLDRLARNDPVGELQLDWFQFGFDLYGKLGAICFTCDDDRKAKALGSSGSNGGPFNNFISHCIQTQTKAINTWFEKPDSNKNCLSDTWKLNTVPRGREQMDMKR